jgi:hypothetical protein
MTSQLITLFHCPTVAPVQITLVIPSQLAGQGKGGKISFPAVIKAHLRRPPLAIKY